jgi:hypothetical protein
MSLAANWWQSSLRKFSLRQSRDGDVATRGPKKNATAKKFRKFATRRKGSAADDAALGRWGKPTSLQSCFRSAASEAHA